MRSGKSSPTLIDVVTMVAVVALLALVTVPRLVKRARLSGRIQCVQNLKNIGLAFRIYSTDSSDAYVPERLLRSGVDRMSIDPLRVYGSHSHLLSSPEYLHCPSEKMRRAAANFQELKNSNISYFVSLSADETLPQVFLAGDRNWTTNGTPVGSGHVTLTTNLTLGYSTELHNGEGNITTGDGSVLQWTSARLDRGKSDQDLATNYLVFP
jgi:hypothetical protein